MHLSLSFIASLLFVAIFLSQKQSVLCENTDGEENSKDEAHTDYGVLLDLLDNPKYFGEWNQYWDDPDHKGHIATFHMSKGLALVPRRGDILVMDSDKVDKAKFLSFQLDLDGILQGDMRTKRIVRVENQIIKYHRGDDLNNPEVPATRECRMETIEIAVGNYPKSSMFNESETYGGGLAIAFINGECPFRFVVMLTAYLDDKGISKTNPYKWLNDYRWSLKQNEFYGEWIMNSDSAQDQTKGYAKVTYDASNCGTDCTQISLDLYDSDYKGKNSLPFWVKLQVDREKLISNNGTIIINYESIFSLIIDSTSKWKDWKSCSSKVALTILNVKTGKPFVPPAPQDYGNAIIQIKSIREIDGCDFSFETTFMTPSFNWDSVIFSISLLTSSTWIWLSLYWRLRLAIKPHINGAETAQFLLILLCDQLISDWLEDTLVQIAFGTFYISLPMLVFWKQTTLKRKCLCIFGYFIPLTIIILKRDTFVDLFTPTMTILFAIPIIDIAYKSYVPAQLVYNKAFYLTNFLPSFILAVCHLYYANYPFLSTQIDLMLLCFLTLSLSFVVLPICVTKIKEARRKKYVVNIKTLKPEDDCPICIQPLISVKPRDETELELLDNKETAKTPLKNIQSRVLKTKCGHLFHEDCLIEWLKSKPECPFCRQDLTELE